MADYDTIVARVIDETLKFAQDSTLRPVKQTKGITIHAGNIEGIPETLFRATGEIDASPERVVLFVRPGPDTMRAKWDSSSKSMSLVQQVSDTVSIIRTITHSAMMGLISARDFVDLSVLRKLDGTDDWICAAQSVEHPDTPHEHGLVRGHNYPCGFWIQSIDGGKRTRFTYVLHTSLRGSLSTSLVESALPGAQISFFEEVKKALTKYP
ncbi:hypothetical protein CAOG_02839 [Capsaspora owczarzaki ATCC 30864]|uniref:START domain-containing protein n=1 Tax=Capsaspora owczarzaki (strain ATCC 30864) TaxID=595528 RepID=A0A0D2WM01_CAPO3|nr:hypothetical protein CAOG_02839 [Capsaspora owczarzaki ATCC 30864]KJE91745.1 hypothetical protein CAOG_002839 [Capsaspora owczarzaki ATCC 30864]|eukprot:XP_004348652.1 hypothetical protein CAOG_02839 [Capsaspora owczarzaki ATCC 30864]